uniref:Uncharacterized protein n=1 Tax=Plectus sambesii TaxID=2011161 RepID=A0A914W459_9BILA
MKTPRKSRIRRERASDKDDDDDRRTIESTRAALPRRRLFRIRHYLSNAPAASDSDACAYRSQLILTEVSNLRTHCRSHDDESRYCSPNQCARHYSKNESTAF